MTPEEATWNAGRDRVDLKELSKMPSRIEKHSACPGCGLFASLDVFMRGIDGNVVFLFNTGCGMVVTTGFPQTSFKVSYVHNLFHNASSTATGIVEMYRRFRAKGEIPDEEITFVCVSGDGGDDIGIDQLIGAALRGDPMIFLEYDNKGYMNTGGQLCYTGILGQRNSNAPVGPARKGKQTQHKDIVEILRGTHVSYLFHAAESEPRDMIRKARKAQAAVRAGGFAFGKLFSVCPLNWGSAPEAGPAIVEKAVKSCLHPLYEVDNGITTINVDPEKSGGKIPVSEVFAAIGGAYAHLASAQFADVTARVQAEVDRRWTRLKAMAESPVL
jgi:pyruvate ferredoxin oxidoreductase alpha subunit